MGKPQIAIIGCGYWGQKLIRIFNSRRDVQLRSVCDFDLPTLARVKRRLPNVQLMTRYEEITSDSQVDAVVVATPISTHFPFARQALLARKHVLVEKPMTSSSSEAEELIELSEKQRKTLMVDHTFLYAAPVRELKSMIRAGSAGDLLYYNSVRISLGFVHNDTNVLWDLGTHEFSILSYLWHSDPIAISAIGAKHFGSPFENVAHISVYFEHNAFAHFHLNSLSPVKVRRTVVGASKKVILYDDIEASEKLKIYNNPAAIHHAMADREKLLGSHQNGDMFAPNLDTTEPLRVMADDFVRAITDAVRPVSDGFSGYRVVRMLEMAQRSIAQDGHMVEWHSRNLPPRDTARFWSRQELPK